MRISDWSSDVCSSELIVGTFRTATQILLGTDETIEHVALGDTVSWEVAVAGHILFLKPRERAGATNLIVTTSRGGTLRNYTFEQLGRASCWARVCQYV